MGGAPCHQVRVSAETMQQRNLGFNFAVSTAITKLGSSVFYLHDIRRLERF